MRLWALDLATNLGECWGDGTQLPSLGHFRLPSTGPDVGEFLSAYREWFMGRLDEVAPTLVAFEAPILAKVTNISTTRKLQGLAGLTEMLCHEEGLPCREASTSAVKKALTGSGKAMKATMVQCARAFGLDPHTNIKDGEEHSDEADAFGCWLATLRLQFPKLANSWDPLMAHVWRAAA